jgi:hypothetical protein
MASPRIAPDAERDRIYEREIREAYLGGVKRSTVLTVVFVGGTRARQDECDA